MSMHCDTDQAHNVYAHTYVSDQSHVHQGNVQNYYLASTFSREQQCHQVLKTSDYESQKDAVPSSSPQTCRWVLDHPDYQHWRKDSGNHIIWISANPGCGKSVLAKLLTDSELPRSHQISICYFFFSIGAQEQEYLATALCAILHQLFTSQSYLLCHAVTEWCRAGDRMKHEIPVLRRILYNAISDPAALPVICVIDAIDECRMQDQQRLIEFICDSIIGPTSSNMTAIKFLVTTTFWAYPKKLGSRLLEGHFLATNITMETFKADTEHGVAEFLEYITRDSDLVPVSIQNFLGQMLYEIIKISLWNCPKVRNKIAHCRGLADGFILQPFKSAPR